MSDSYHNFDDPSMGGYTRTPDTSPSRLGSEPEIIDRHEEEAPTASHTLAEDSIEIDSSMKGASQLQHDEVEVKDLGWNDDVQRVPQPVVGGLNNEELWTLIRRFNKQVFQVKTIGEVPLADLDMNISTDDAFSPDKLRAQLERLYMTVVVSMMFTWKHIVRLRSWKEWKRTSAFMAAYSIAWLLDLVIPTVTAFLMVLILYPKVRVLCFPPVPPSIVDSKTGGVQKPPAGVLASADTMTGAPEKHEGEGVEQEAHNFVNSIASVVISSSAGSEDPTPTQVAQDFADAKDTTKGNKPNTTHDKTKKPVDNIVWSNVGPVMHLISEVVDTWERFGNALNPVAPFPVNEPRMTLACCLLPVLFVSFFLTSYMAMKGLGFGVGFGFFGDPIITPLLSLVNKTYPRWEKFTELRHTILRGVPTNAQLAITLLRVGERNKAPLPPPPTSDIPPPIEANQDAMEDVENLGVGVTNEEAMEAAEPDFDHEGIAKEQEQEQKKPKRAHRILNLLKGTTRGGVHTALTADKAKAAAGARQARNRLGVVNKPESTDYTSGPICFPARYGGKKGHVYITATATTPALSWTSDIEDVNPAWTVAIEEITEIKKVGGLGWKSKILVGWAMDREVMDGLLVKIRDGKEYHLTAIMIRDELFNRLIAMGHQMWEAC